MQMMVYLFSKANRTWLGCANDSQRVGKTSRENVLRWKKATVVHRLELLRTEDRVSPRGQPCAYTRVRSSRPPLPPLLVLYLPNIIISVSHAVRKRTDPEQNAEIDQSSWEAGYGKGRTRKWPEGTTRDRTLANNGSNGSGTVEYFFVFIKIISPTYIFSVISQII